jgi:hypothetical protein
MITNKRWGRRSVATLRIHLSTLYRKRQQQYKLIADLAWTVRRPASRITQGAKTIFSYQSDRKWHTVPSCSYSVSRGIDYVNVTRTYDPHEVFILCQRTWARRHVNFSQREIHTYLLCSGKAFIIFSYIFFLFLVGWDWVSCYCPSATLSTTNPIWLDPVLNTARRSGKLATNRLSYGAADFSPIIGLLILVFFFSIWEHN